MSDLREALEAAMDQPSTAADDVTTVVETEPSTESADQGLEPTTATADSAATPTEEPAANDLNAAAETEARKRGPDGKFIPKEAKLPENPPETTENPGIVAGPKSGEPPKPGEKAPITWRPEVRAEWDKLPESVKQTVATRERQVQQVLNESAEARKFTEVINKTIAPYSAMLQAENIHPVAMVDDLLRTAQVLRTGPAATKVEIAANIITKFGIDLRMLDQVLSGQKVQDDPVQSQVEQLLQQKLAPIEQHYNQLRQQQEYEERMKDQMAEQTVMQFVDSVPYGRDVAQTMALLINNAQAQGKALSLQEAYESACYADPGIRSLMQQQQQTGNLQNRAQAAAKAKGAAVSVSGAPGASDGTAQQADSVRAAIENALTRVGR